MRFQLVSSVILFGVLSFSAPVSGEVSKTFRCESKDFSSRECTYPGAPRDMRIKDVRLLRQISSRPCEEGQTWEAREYGVVVSGGCRGEFQVIFDEAREDDHWRRNHGHDRYSPKEKWSYDHPPSRRPDEAYPGVPEWSRQNDQYATDIIVGVFQDLLNRYPTHAELRNYRRLILEEHWSRRDVRRDVERRYSRYQKW